MAFIAVNEGLLKVLNGIATNASPYTLSFYTSPTTALSYAVDATWTTAHFAPATGFTPAVTLGLNFASAVSAASTVAVASLTASPTGLSQTYTNTVAQTIQGFYINDSAGKLVFATNLSALTVSASGDQIQLTSLNLSLTAA